jgi:hypothetical protein
MTQFKCPLMKTPRSAIVLLAALSGCNLSKNLDEAKRATEHFHEQLAAGEDEAIYDQATPAFQDTLRRDVAKGYFARIRRKMGTCGSSQSTDISMNTNTQGTFVTLGFETHCSAGQLAESFVWLMENGQARLQSYNASSAALLVD